MDALCWAKVTQIPGWAPSVNLEVKDYVATGEESEEDRPKSDSALSLIQGGILWSRRRLFLPGIFLLDVIIYILDPSK